MKLRDIIVISIIMILILTLPLIGSYGSVQKQVKTETSLPMRALSISSDGNTNSFKLVTKVRDRESKMFVQRLGDILDKKVAYRQKDDSGIKDIYEYQIDSDKISTIKFIPSGDDFELVVNVDIKER